ncbi:hypothetical protein BaRGS_00000037 [Batillaria attramentaria]|uniref:Secreted protein n=1 Tax=Batillaria attramentaria TaxID=370345 RepID=A0ABD0MBL4_9CAEN
MIRLKGKTSSLVHLLPRILLFLFACSQTSSAPAGFFILKSATRGPTNRRSFNSALAGWKPTANSQQRRSLEPFCFQAAPQTPAPWTARSVTWPEIDGIVKEANGQIAVKKSANNAAR